VHVKYNTDYKLFNYTYSLETTDVLINDCLPVDTYSLDNIAILEQTLRSVYCLDTDGYIQT